MHRVPPSPGARRAPERTPEHRRALEQAVLGAFTTERPCRGKHNRPPGQAALAEAQRLRGESAPGVVVDLDDYARIAKVAGR